MRSENRMEQARWRTPLVLARAACLLGMMLALSGCAVGPKFVKPEPEINQEWKQQDPLVKTQATPDSAWWRAFNDPTLDSLIATAYRQNLPLQVAGLRILESRARLGIAKGQRYPQIQVVAGHATAVGLSENMANSAGMDRYYGDYQLGFDALWELDFWQKYKSGINAEAAGYLGSVADYDDALVLLTAEVARTYAVIRTFEVLIEQTRRNAALQEEGLRIAEARYRNGATSELDVAQATTLLQSTRTTIPQLEIRLQQSRNALSTLLGQPTGTVEVMLQGGAGIPVAPADVAVSIPAELLRRRPDIRSAELAAFAQCSRIGIAKADLYPRLSLFGSIGTQTTSGAGSASVSNLFGAGSLFYAVGPRLLWSVFNYGRIKNNVRVEDARFQQTLVAYDNTVLQAAQEVEDGLTGYLKSREATLFADSAATSAQRSVDLAFIQYREGAVDFQRVLDAQRALLAEQNTLAQTRSAVATNLIALYKALGGGWEIRRGQRMWPESTETEMEQRTDWGDAFAKPPALPTSTGLSQTP